MPHKPVRKTMAALVMTVSLGQVAAAQPPAPFVFHNNFWVNLHQALYADAGRTARAGEAGRVGQEVAAGRATGAGTADQAGRGDRTGGLDRSGWSAADLAAWRAALDAYADLARRDQVFDATLVAVNDALGRAPTVDTLTDAAIDPAIRAALNQAAPVYRLRVWPRQRPINDAWIADMKPRVDRHGAALTRALAHAYHTAWPSAPILIDVSGDAGPFGAYTTNAGPAGFAAHATMSPAGRGAEGEMALETIFHEASHAVDASIMRMIAAECAVQKVAAPQNLWHALIFYTTGELVRRQVGMVGDEHYMPYAYRFDVYGRGMEHERAALEQHWQPWLDGKVTVEAALRNLVRDTTR